MERGTDSLWPGVRIAAATRRGAQVGRHPRCSAPLRASARDHARPQRQPRTPPRRRKRLLEQMNVEFHPTDRGGDITYHGPGQIVGYPIPQLTQTPPRRPLVRGATRRSHDSRVGRLRDFGETRRRPAWRLDRRGGGTTRSSGSLGVHLKPLGHVPWLCLQRLNRSQLFRPKSCPAASPARAPRPSNAFSAAASSVPEVRERLRAHFASVPLFAREVTEITRELGGKPRRGAPLIGARRFGGV